MRYDDKRLIHLVLDNYVIHSILQTRLCFQQNGQRLRLHFLPPYDPDDNRIERKVWREVHANVTINHERQNIDQLCIDVTHYRMQHNRRAERLGVREARSAI